MRITVGLLLAGAFLLASCAPEPAPAPTGTPLPSVTPVLHAPEIRFALIGEPQDVNVWELFDETGASYADYALRSEYWPRLYHLVPPDFTFEAQAARDMPSAVTKDGEAYSATVSLRDDLKWTDGTPFTAEDVAFTVNNAVSFELGFDWSAYYPVEYLERAEAVDGTTVKFIFKQQPNVKVWQYGALQGPILQRVFWESKIVEAANLLPDQTLRQALEDARLQLQNVQTRVNDLTAQSIAMASVGQDNREVLIELQNQQNNLIFAQNTLNKLEEEVAGKFQSAQGALYEVDDRNEPTLGTWVPAGEQNGVWVNEANPDVPFLRPNFDQAVYNFYPDDAAVLLALERNEVDVILGAHGTANFAVEVDPSLPVVTSESLYTSFIVVNLSNPPLADPALRRAIYCAGNTSVPVQHPSFVSMNNSAWFNPDSVIPCGDEAGRSEVVSDLKLAGYSWVTEPTTEQTGTGLRLPDGSPFPSITLLAPSESEVAHKQRELEALGIPVTVQIVPPHEIRYRVFSSRRYDMAILSWNLSLYPGYLCDWFGAGGQFEYGRESLRSECGALGVTSDLEAARAHIYQIQSILMEDLPFIPLYSDIRYDAYRNVTYPFEHVLGGLGSLYGAPSYAMPAP